MQDEAVSDIVGNILLVAMTVLGMAGVGVAVYMLPGPEQPVHADLTVVSTSTSLKVRHLGGEEIPVAETRFLVVADGARAEARAADLSLGASWEIGEEACLVGSDPGCLHTWDGRSVTELHVIVGDHIVADWEGSVRR